MEGKGELTRRDSPNGGLAPPRYSSNNADWQQRGIIRLFSQGGPPSPWTYCSKGLFPCILPQRSVRDKPAAPPPPGCGHRLFLGGGHWRLWRPSWAAVWPQKTDGSPNLKKKNQRHQFSLETCAPGHWHSFQASFQPESGAIEASEDQITSVALMSSQWVPPQWENRTSYIRPYDFGVQKYVGVWIGWG